jgi:leucyl/phenylalanyl-tRNA--protein transferase
MNNRVYSEEEFLLLPQNMIYLYSIGAFPMTDEFGKVNWHYPIKRTIIPLDNFNIPRSLKKILASDKYDVFYDKDFKSVVNYCSERKETWISQKIINGYLALEKLGYIHTVEVYKQNKLVGGLYGVANRGAFFGESMFSKESQASKIALVKLIQHLKEKNFLLLDVQYLTEHLKMFGAMEISLELYQDLLSNALKQEIYF